MAAPPFALVTDTEPAPAPAGRGTVWACAYALLAVAGLAYFLLGVPVQVSDSFGNMASIIDQPFWQVVSAQFGQQAYLRPFLWASLKAVLPLAEGRYYEWFRGLHAVQVLVLAWLALRLFRPVSMRDAMVVPLLLAALFGVHTFSLAVRQAFPINTFLTILICCVAMANLSLARHRWWVDMAAAALLVFATLTLESGLLVAVIAVAMFLTGAPGVSRAGVAGQVALVLGYLWLRFAYLDVGGPNLLERSSGFGFGMLEPEELVARFGGAPLGFYAYNVVTSLLSVLFGEPRAGVWEAVAGVTGAGPLRASTVITIAGSTLGTGVILWFCWTRRREWLARRFDRDSRLVLTFGAVLAANAVISYPYTKDVIMSPAGVFFAVALGAAVRQLLQASPAFDAARFAATVLVLGLASSAWAVRSLGVHASLRDAALSQRNQWAYVDGELDLYVTLPMRPAVARLKNALQDDAVVRYPGPQQIRERWRAWLDFNR